MYLHKVYFLHFPRSPVIEMDDIPMAAVNNIICRCHLCIRNTTLTICTTYLNIYTYIQICVDEFKTRRKCALNHPYNVDHTSTTHQRARRTTNDQKPTKTQAKTIRAKLGYIQTCSKIVLPNKTAERTGRRRPPRQCNAMPPSVRPLRASTRCHTHTDTDNTKGPGGRNF